MADRSKPAISSQKVAGALFVIEGVRRSVKIYGIQESELNHLATLNGLATFRYALAGSLFSAAFALLSGLFIEGSPSELACRVVPVAALACALLGGVFAYAGYVASKTKKSELDRIKQHGSDVFPSN